jgi:hypothetical protein
MTAEVHIALLHHPVVNKTGEVITTAVTNLDIHDNARSARTFGCASFHIVTPLDAQVELVGRIMGHWRDGFGARRVPNRVDAMNLVRIDRTLDAALQAIVDGRDVQPVLVATAARRTGAEVLAHDDLRSRMLCRTEPFVLLFGTGYGLSREVLERADVVLEPIGDPDDWNHLSVRAAVAITLDRLLGER